mmetsp:Transcript_32533/g.95203  ORF Transcript_32533/g.95203 Transcript_32533/m.95203 type:complete len:140 (-) Transcript_32533:122-541(-)
MFCCCASDAAPTEVLAPDEPAAQLPVPEAKAAVETDASNWAPGGGPMTFHITIEKTTDLIGLDVAAIGQNLRVKRISSGLVQKWNEQHPDRAVRPDDLIVEVNGTRGGGPEAPAGEAHLPLLHAIQGSQGLDIGFYRHA